MSLLWLVSFYAFALRPQCREMPKAGADDEELATRNPIKSVQVRIAQAEFDKPVAVAQEKGQGDPWPRSMPTRQPALRSQRPKYKEGLQP